MDTKQYDAIMAGINRILEVCERNNAPKAASIPMRVSSGKEDRTQIVAALRLCKLSAFEKSFCETAEKGYDFSEKQQNSWDRMIATHFPKGFEPSTSGAPAKSEIPF